MPGPSDTDRTPHWPAGFSPGCADVWAVGEAVSHAAPADVFAHLISGREPAAVFGLEVGGLRIDAHICELVAGRRVAWSGLGIDISTYHSWVVCGDPGGSRILAGFAARGAAAIALREPDPGLPQRMIDKWIADVKKAAERPDP